MTNIEIRVKIAESLGWKWWKHPPTGNYSLCTPNDNDLEEWELSNIYLASIKPEFLMSVPNYPNDLNACCEFEKTLFGTEKEVYIVVLYDIIKNEKLNWTDLVSASAERRCEAYLRLKKLWKD